MTTGAGPTCAWCERALAPGEGRTVPSWLRYAAAFTLAFAHAGMWAMQLLAKPFCPRCRGGVIAGLFFILAAALAAVGAAIRLWLSLSASWGA